MSHGTTISARSFTKIVTDPVSGREVYVDDDFEADTYENSADDLGHALELHLGYDTMDFIRNRASIDELLDFANDVRKAGGAEIINELLMSNPQDSEQCLIANALNFDSMVNDDWGVWAMHTDDVALIEDICSRVNLDPVWNDDPDYADAEKVGIELPEPIAFVAQAFDTYVDVELEKYDVTRENNTDNPLVEA